MQQTPRSRIRPLALAALAWLPLPGSAGTPARQPLPDAARIAIEQLVQAQAAGLPRRIGVRLQGPGGGTLPPCEAPEAFLAPGTALRGRVSIGLRCPAADAPWTRYVQAYVEVQGRYFVAARAIEAGQALGAADLAERSGDLAALPRSVVTDAAPLRGVIAANRISAGAPLRKELLRGQVVIQQGQWVQVVAQGAGFSVSTEAKAMTRAEVGALVQAKTRDGRLVSGVADEEGQIRLAQ
ncbi:flagellar basal body P-ring formation chaperone FlgA [Variovorax sp. LARHSF232]